MVRKHTVAAACLVAACGSSIASAVYIPAGYDYFITEPDTYMGFEPGTTLPAGFFGSLNGLLSDPMPLPPALPLTGRPIGTVPPNIDPHFIVNNLSEAARLGRHNVVDPRVLAKNLHDTIVRRHADVALNAIGDSETIPIEIIWLSLQSEAPIMVTFGNGQLFSGFDLWVGLDPGNPSPRGTMTITRTSEFGGTITSILPVNFQVDFRALDPLVVPSHSYINGQIVFEGVGTWIPGPSALSLLGLAGLVAGRRRR